MRRLTVWVMGDGARDVTVTDGTTLATLAREQGLTNYDFTVDERVIPRSNWDTAILDGVSELWATEGVKGA